MTDLEAPRCGQWMKIAKEPCGKPPGHRGRHMGAIAYAHRREQGRAYDRSHDKSRVRPDDYDAYRRLYKFGISPARLQRMINDQSGRCPVCRASLSELPTHRVHVDHDRGCCPGQKSCGKCIRGVLCGTCNIWLGHYQGGRIGDRTTEEVRGAMDSYLADPPALRPRTVQIRAAHP